MKFGKQNFDEVEGVPVTPLIDIVFLTLVFFMVTSVYGALESEVDITLPTADSGIQSERLQGEIFINVRDDGAIIVNERDMEIEELQSVLKRIAEYFPGGSVIIRADRTVVHGRVMQVLDACRQADIQNVSFAVQPQDSGAAGVQ